jgi:hypothetical protein
MVDQLSEGTTTTVKLPRFALHVPTLWQDDLPSIMDVVQAVQDMLKEA